jgi:hypothetical protein
VIRQRFHTALGACKQPTRAFLELEKKKKTKEKRPKNSPFTTMFFLTALVLAVFVACISAGTVSP